LNFDDNNKKVAYFKQEIILFGKFKSNNNFAVQTLGLLFQVNMPDLISFLGLA